MMLQQIRERLHDCQDVVYKELNIGLEKQLKLTIIYTDGLANIDLLNEFVVNPILLRVKELPGDRNQLRDCIFDLLYYRALSAPEMKEQKNIEEIITAIFNGDAIIYIQGLETVIGVSVKGWPGRGVSEPTSERLVRGPRDAFVETYRFNTALVRRRIKDSNLKLEQMQIGRRSQTAVGVFYMKDIALPQMVQEVLRRLRTIDIDGVLESGYIEQLIEDNTLSPFPQMKATERPDEVAAGLLEGRIAILVDNSPFALIVPITLNALYHSPEDFYDRFIIATVLRCIRIVASAIALLLPALYIAISAYTPGILPTKLLLSMAVAREGVVFGVVVEALIMEFALELLREASIRLPSAVGSTIGIVGGLVIGQSAVEAHLVSPIMVIIVAITAIANFAIPTYALSTGFRLVRFSIMALTAALGLYGLQLGIIFFICHLVMLKSFDIPYLSPFVASNITDMKDSFVRMPLYMMKKRPKGMTKNKIRLKNNRKKI